MDVEVVRSAKRRKSVSARVVDGRIVVRMPQWMSKAQEAEYVAALVAKLERQQVRHGGRPPSPSRGPRRPLRPARAHVDPLGHEPEPALGIVHAVHRRDPDLRPHRRRSRSGCSTRCSCTSWPTSCTCTTRRRSGSWCTATRRRSGPTGSSSRSSSRTTRSTWADQPGWCSPQNEVAGSAAIRSSSMTAPHAWQVP